MDKDIITVGGRVCAVFSSDPPECLLIQPSGRHEAALLGKEVSHISQLADKPFAFAACGIADWNTELSPWEAPPAFGNTPFGSGAADTLAYIENELIPALIAKLGLNEDIPLILGGYSLAGLFALWSAYSTDRFRAAAAVSPSLWFPGWLKYAESRSPSAGSIYLSLGKKEEKTRNAVMSSVGDAVRRQSDILTAQGVGTVLEWNEGNHFTEPEIRTAKGFAWCINNTDT